MLAFILARACAIYKIKNRFMLVKNEVEVHEVQVAHLGYFTLKILLQLPFHRAHLVLTLLSNHAHSSKNETPGKYISHLVVHFVNTRRASII
jgi:hypothetical protein